MNSELIAITEQVVGSFYILTGLTLFFGKSAWLRFIERLREDEGLVFVTGFFALLFGLTIVYAHPAWDSVGAAVVSAIGYIGAIKGFTLLTWPDKVMKMVPQVTDKWLRLEAPVVVALGAWILWSASA